MHPSVLHVLVLSQVGLLAFKGYTSESYKSIGAELQRWTGVTGVEDQACLFQRELQITSAGTALSQEDGAAAAAAVAHEVAHREVAHREVRKQPTLAVETMETGPEELELNLDSSFFDDQELTGHLHHMAHHARWAGWQFFSRDDQDINGHPQPHGKSKVQDSGVNFFRSVGVHEWIILIVVCVCLCALDGIVLRRLPDTFRWHTAVIFIWIFIAGLYLWGVWSRMGRHYGVQWASGYVLEWMLSMDNLFIFHLVFKSYKTPQNQIHKAVFVGIIGAVVMRMVFFLVVSTLLHAVGWFRWPFGAMLVWSGIEAVRGEEEDDGDVKDTRLVRVLQYLFGGAIKDGYDTEGTAIIMYNKVTGRVQLSLLFVVIMLVEFSDIIFALDSVSAKVAQIPNQYIAFSSSVMAMYGLRAMFFIVEDLVQMFDLLQYGLGVILVFIGVELMFTRWIHVGSGVECILIVAIFAVCIVASKVKNCIYPEEEGEEDEKDNAEEAQEAKGNETKHEGAENKEEDDMGNAEPGAENEQNGIGPGAITVRKGSKSLDAPVQQVPVKPKP